MNAPQKLVLTVQGLTLQGLMWRSQDPQAPRILALHGWLDNAESFTPLSSHLHTYTLVAIDLPGHGRSEHRHADASYHFIDWVESLFAILDALGWGTAILMGHSMGAGICTLAAATLPERVEALILLDALAPYTSEAESMPERLADHLKKTSRRQQRAMRPYPTVQQAVASLRRVVPLLSADHAGLIVARNTRPVPGGFVWCADPRLRSTSAMTLSQAQLAAFLHRVTAPALFIRAPDGLALEQATLQWQIAAIKNLQTVEISGGHHVHMQKAPVVAASVVAWLSRLGR